ncbi:MAG: YeiH family putative sulfate export transporter [Arcobacter butzleri]|jgi:uncharacterized integral membrane protein (TIGR00698 family)|nr:YeiH family protein [Arcobacteraceae bacterium]MDY0364889.1 YeiH family protein [Arcobacteraceae bacterium]NLO17523.1 YeiH family putative sulfate export transporter [Aliarcobacter butzleri]
MYKKNKNVINGVLFVSIFAAAATMLADISIIKNLGLSPLVIGIVLGIFYANTMDSKIPKEWDSGINFSAKKILRFAIVFYGFRITFTQIAEVGLEGFLVSLIMLVSTFILGTYVGIKWFGLDKDISMLNASGASVCGAAAVLATEPVLKSDPYKAAIAVSMVVLFGTIAMFLYPAIYASGLLDMSSKEFGIYVGATIHEVAQVVAVGGAFDEIVSNNAIIVKMTRVLLIAPMLIILGIFLSLSSKNSTKSKLVIPWFAVYFVFVAGFNTLALLPQDIVDIINEIDTFLLTIAMTALGMGTKFSKFKSVGAKPFYAGGVMFVWLVVGGYFVTKMVVSP